MQADVFCRVIDNYGDIGVTWRLVRQLCSDYGWQIRLWVDDLHSFQRIEPRIAITSHQNINGIEIVDWSRATDFTSAGVVIATFSCDLPEQYLENLRKNHAYPPLWINLEYLSAENWVEGCHGLPSLRADGLSSHFFFPGFSPKTGGLLRESDLLRQRNTWLADVHAQRNFLKNIGLSAPAMHALFPDDQHNPQPRARLITLFCYDNAPVHSLVETLKTNPLQTVLLIPHGIHSAYQTTQFDQLLIERIPFLPQTEYDKLLWTADLNFVRGEDSIVRGIWTGKPLIWQIYPQTENTHLDKLQAWLDLAALPDEIQQAIRSWNPESTENSDNNENAPSINQSGYKKKRGVDFSKLLGQQLEPEHFQIWQQHAARFSQEQCAMKDLARSLTEFCLSKQIPKI